MTDIINNAIKKDFTQKFENFKNDPTNHVNFLGKDMLDPIKLNEFIDKTSDIEMKIIAATEGYSEISNILYSDNMPYSFTWRDKQEKFQWNDFANMLSTNVSDSATHIVEQVLNDKQIMDKFTIEVKSDFTLNNYKSFTINYDDKTLKAKTKNTTECHEKIEKLFECVCEKYPEHITAKIYTYNNKIKHEMSGEEMLKEYKYIEEISKEQQEQSEKVTLYLVIGDDGGEQLGNYADCIGVFDDKEKAEKWAELKSEYCRGGMSYWVKEQKVPEVVLAQALEHNKVNSRLDDVHKR